MEAGLLWFCNWSTLGVCAALKLPQIYAQLAARSARGISLPSLLLELAGFLVFFRYQCYYGNPLLTYLEYPILIAQDIILLLFVFHFNGNVKQALPYMAVFVSSWFILSLQKWIIDLAMNLCTVISAASKFAQLQYLWKVQDSEAVSALSWGLSAYTCATRIITTLMTTNDFTIPHNRTLSHRQMRRLEPREITENSGSSEDALGLFTISPGRLFRHLLSQHSRGRCRLIFYEFQANLVPKRVSQKEKKEEEEEDEYVFMC